MLLELAQFPVRDVRWGNDTAYRAGVLTVNRRELQAHLDDPRLTAVDVHLARPGEAVRIVHVIDVVEPRVKADGNGATYFAGLLGPLQLAGRGRTHVLKGLTVVVSAALQKAQEGIIDMSGSGSELTKFGRTLNVVLVPAPASHISEDEFVRAVLQMKLKAAVYLAKATLGQQPVEVESFALATKSAPELPRAAYIYYLQSRGFSRERLFYGISTQGTMPTPVHANEILDGALVFNGHTSPSKSVTFNHMNSAAIRALYARDGKDLSIAGVILANHHSDQEQKEHTALLAARMAKEILGADAALISKDGGGQGDVDVMLCCSRCGELGLPVVLLAKEEGGEGGTFPLVATSPYADAIVSMGNGTTSVSLTASIEVVLGGDALYDGQNAAGPLVVPCNALVGSNDVQGGVYLASEVS